MILALDLVVIVVAGKVCPWWPNAVVQCRTGSLATHTELHPDWTPTRAIDVQHSPDTESTLLSLSKPPMGFGIFSDGKLCAQQLDSADTSHRYESAFRFRWTNVKRTGMNLFMIRCLMVNRCLNLC